MSEENEKPEECQGCGASEVDMEKYENFKTRWLCTYCANSFNVEETTNMASMFNALEKRMKQFIKEGLK